MLDQRQKDLSQIEREVEENRSLTDIVAARSNIPAPNLDPVEKGLYRATTSTSINSNNFNHRHVEYLLQTGVEYLTRAIAQRNECQELALRAMHDILTAWRSEMESDSLVRSIQDGKHSKQAEALLGWATAMEKWLQSPEGKESPKYEETKAAVDKAKIEKEALDAEIAFIKEGVRVATLYSREVRAKQDIPGHALNHKERIEALKRAFYANFFESHARLKSASIGIGQVFRDTASVHSLAKDFPTLSETNEVGFVDMLLEWSRSAVSTVERILKRDNVYTIILAKSKYEAEKTPTGATWTFEPTLTAEHFPGLRNIRLQSFRVSTVSDVVTPSDLATYRTHHSRYAGDVELPRQKEMEDVGYVAYRVPLGAIVRFHDEGGTVESPSIFNADPIGKWAIRIFAQSAHAISNKDDKGPADIFLEITVRAT